MIFENDALTFQITDVLRLENTCAAQVHVENRGRNFCALSYRVRTDAVIYCREQEIKMRPGSVTFFPANTDYQRRATLDEMIVVHFDILNFSASQIDCFYPSQPDEVQRRFEEIYRVWQQSTPERRYLATGMLYSLFALLHEDYRRAGRQQDTLCQCAARYIAEHYAEATLTVPQVARAVGVCDVYLRRLFRQEMQISPKQYIERLRMQRAVSLIQSGYYTIAQVAHECGFSDEKYFSTVFKRTTGTQPSRYLYDFVP